MSWKLIGELPDTGKPWSMGKYEEQIILVNELHPPIILEWDDEGECSMVELKPVSRRGSKEWGD